MTKIFKLEKKHPEKAKETWKDFLVTFLNRTAIEKDLIYFKRDLQRMFNIRSRNIVNKCQFCETSFQDKIMCYVIYDEGWFDIIYLCSDNCINLYILNSDGKGPFKYRR